SVGEVEKGRLVEQIGAASHRWDRVVAHYKYLRTPATQSAAARRASTALPSVGGSMVARRSATRLANQAHEIGRHRSGSFAVVGTRVPMTVRKASRSASGQSASSRSAWRFPSGASIFASITTTPP